MPDLTAGALAEDLSSVVSAAEQEKIRSRMTDPAAEVRGVRMGTLFALAKARTAKRSM